MKNDRPLEAGNQYLVFGLSIPSCFYNIYAFIRVVGLSGSSSPSIGFQGWGLMFGVRERFRRGLFLRLSYRKFSHSLFAAFEGHIDPFPHHLPHNF